MLCDDVEIGGLLFLLHKNQHKYLNNAVKSYGLNIMQVLFIIRLYHFPETTQKELGEYFFLTKGSVAKSLKNLEKDGFIERKRLEDNQRQYKLILTEKSLKLIPEFKEISQEWNRKVNLEAYGEDFINKLKDLTIKSIEINGGAVN